jgi:hypothetical protein
MDMNNALLLPKTFGSELRFAMDSPLEGRVMSELVSGTQIPCYAGKIQGISSILPSVV